MNFTMKKYAHDANGGGGTSASSSSGSSAVVKIDLETYNYIVDSIEKCKDEIIMRGARYIVPDDECLLNNVVPDYQQADHEVFDMLKLMKSETALVIKAMRTMRDNYKKVDKTKAAETVYGNGAASTGSSGTGTGSGTGSGAGTGSGSGTGSGTGTGSGSGTGSSSGNGSSQP